MRLPCSFFPAPPPYQPNSCRILLFTQYTLRIRQETWLIRKIVAPFIAHQEAIAELVVKCSRGLLQSLR